MTDPTLGPDGTDAVDLDPEGCAYTWTPGPDTPLAQRFTRVRCTRPRHDDDRHHWDAREQEERTERVKARLLEGMGLEAALIRPLEATPILIRPEGRADELRRFARHLLGPLYTAADVEGAIVEHLKAERS